MGRMQGTYLWLTCDDERVGNRGLSEHGLYVASEQLESLSPSAVGVHQDHGSARSPQLRVHHT